MAKKQRRFSVISVIAGAAVLAFLAIIGFSIFQQHKNTGLSSQQIQQKFDCNRITLDVRQTDIFCGDPKFFNNPDSITSSDYYEYLACEERFKNGAPSESSKENDPGFYYAYYDCKDPAELERQRQDLIEALKKLKSENS